MLVLVLAVLAPLPTLALVLGSRSVRSQRTTGIYDRVAAGLAKYSVKYRSVILIFACVLLAATQSLASCVLTQPDFDKIINYPF